MKLWLGTTLLAALSLGLFAPYSAFSETLDPDYIVDRSDYNPDHPWFQTAKSEWSFGFRTAQKSFPSNASSGDSYQLNVDWILGYQKLGVFSIGPELGLLYLNHPALASSSANFFNPLAGAQLRYQLKIWTNQAIVPTAAISYDYYQLKTTSFSPSEASGAQLSTDFGLLFNLSWLDPQTAKEAFESLGMTRAYLSAELQLSSFNNPVFSMDSKLYTLGFRLEFE